MALKSGRVGVCKDQVDHYGRIKEFDDVEIEIDNLTDSLDGLSDIVLGANNHSSIYRGKDISSYLQDGTLYKRINGTDGFELFEDLYIGDYFDITMPANELAANTQTVRCMIVDFDYYLRKGDTETTFHHVVIMPFNSFADTAKMEETNITSNGYAGSVMHTTTLPIYATSLTSVFSTHLKTFRDLLSNAGVSSGASMAGAGFSGYASNWAWSNVTLRLPNEVQIFGTKVLSSSFYDVGCANSQFALFRMKPERIVAMNGGVAVSSRYYWWLSAVASASHFATVNNRGYANYAGASVAYGVRPFWLLS